MMAKRRTARPSPSVVPLSRAGTDRFVPWLIAPMVYLASLAVFVALGLTELAERWDTGLSGSLTVQLPATADEAARTSQMDIVLDALRTWPGVAAARPVEAPEMADLLEPWLGPDLPFDTLPVPALVDVTLERGAPADAAALGTALAAVAPGATVDDHGAWRQDLLAIATSARLIALLLVCLFGLAAVIAIIFVTKAGLAIHRPVIDLLHLIGATDGFVARQFERHILGLSASGAALGLGLTLATLGGLAWALSGMENLLLPRFPTEPAQWIGLAAVPVATSLLAVLTARITVLRALARLP